MIAKDNISKTITKFYILSNVINSFIFYKVSIKIR
jgi:hypothetical protein